MYNQHRLFVKMRRRMNLSGPPLQLQRHIQFYIIFCLCIDKSVQAAYTFISLSQHKQRLCNRMYVRKTCCGK